LSLREAFPIAQLSQIKASGPLFYHSHILSYGRSDGAFCRQSLCFSLVIWLAKRDTEQADLKPLEEEETMEPKLVALKLFLDELDIPASIATIDDRKRVQKAVYLGQLSGVDLRYRFGWYLKGPYSPSLTKDYFSLAETLTSGDQTYIGKQFSASVRERLRSVLPLMQVPEEAGLPLEDWLELVSSLHYLRKIQGLDENSADYKLQTTKPHLAHLRSLAKDHLSRINLLP
jgi:hypothetical protein